MLKVSGLLKQAYHSDFRHFDSVNKIGANVGRKSKSAVQRVQFGEV